MGWTTRVQFLAGAMMGIFIFATMTRPGVGPTSILTNEYHELLPEVKLLGCETDHRPPSSAKVTTVGNYTSTPQYIFMA
jgi:hypothetical protein